MTTGADRTQPRAMQSASEAPIISMKGVGKLYYLRKQKPFLLREVFRRLLPFRARGEEFWALRDVDLEVRRGESVGIIGTNGAGKSTLLSIAAGAVHPTTGTVRVSGRVGALLALGAGFHPDLTGRENIYLNASLLGLSKNEIEVQFKSIVDFAELWDFIDVQLRLYSSGMHVRLGFAVAAHIDPQILLMDEALAVGDHAFQAKCIERILEFKKRGATLLFVSHSSDMVRSLCDRAVWLVHGRVKADGKPDKVLAAYASA